MLETVVLELDLFQPRADVERMAPRRAAERAQADLAVVVVRSGSGGIGQGFDLVLGKAEEFEALHAPDAVGQLHKLVVRDVQSGKGGNNKRLFLAKGFCFILLTHEGYHREV